MASEWKEYSFGDAPLQILDGDRGKNYPKKSEFKEQGHCLFLNTGNVTPIGFVFSSNDFVSKKRDELLRKGKMQREDIVLTTRGTVGNVAYFDNGVPYDHIRINSGMVILRPDLCEIFPRFLYLFLRSTQLKLQVEGLTTGSAQPQLPIRDIKRILITLPPLSEQKAIAHVLGSLDDKIELNRKMNETLEAMAQTLFKSWFVDFDPVIDNIILKNSKKYPSPNLSQGARNNSSPFEEQGNEGSIFDGIPDEFLERAEARKEKLEETYGSLEAASSHFSQNSQNPQISQISHISQISPLTLHTSPFSPTSPLTPHPSPFPQFSSEFVETDELGWIPKGWEVSTVLKHSKKISKGTTPSKKNISDSYDSPVIPFLKVRDIDDKGSICSNNLDMIPASVHNGVLKRSVLETGDVLFSIAGTIGRVSIVPDELHDSNLNQAIAFIRAKAPKEALYIVYLLRSSFIQNRVHSRVVQGVQANVSLTEIGKLPIIEMNEVIFDCWSKQIDSIYKKKTSIEMNTFNLTKLRDTLLPKLLSGEVRVPEAEKLVEDVE